MQDDRFIYRVNDHVLLYLPLDDHIYEGVIKEPLGVLYYVVDVIMPNSIEERHVHPQEIIIKVE